MTTQTISSLLRDQHSKPGELESDPQALEDLQWLAGLTALLRSHADFLLAQFMEDETVIDRAADVMTWREGRFFTVRELVEICASHKWNSTIYEAWIWETAQQVRALIRHLDATAARAMTVYAQSLDYYEVDTDGMQAALDKARRAMEGERVRD